MKVYLEQKKAGWMAGAAVFLCSGLGFSAETSLPFLNMSVGAHAQSMGGAYMALAEDGSANATNPAAIAGAEKRNIFLYHSRFVSGYTYNYLGYAHPFQSRKSGFGLAMGYLSKGDFQGRDQNGVETGSFNANDTLLTLTYSRKMSSAISLGAGANFIHSSVESVSASGFAFDFSGSYRLSENTNFAAGVFHLGPAISYANQKSDLPSQISAGLAHQFFGALTLTGDARYGLKNQNFTLGFGGQMSLAKIASLRLGYTSQISKSLPVASNSNSSINNLSGLGMGMGLKLFSKTSLDYAFVPMGELGGTHHMDLSWGY
ncbi:MAG: hypothetical protein A2901_07870 [Elusimicrobia bacterium RIFCSPLOWO2_01_FULL_54_10]|nr:MAG: hypothetical protein A2901_07870 [Elusimicrobia bacterium RIFCSPLOWO2_01_FULL_54_10]